MTSTLGEIAVQKELLPIAYYIDFGPELFLPNDTLDHIVDCFHTIPAKFKSLEDIWQETQSHTATEYSNKIFAILNSICSTVLLPSPFTTTPRCPPLQTISANSPTDESPMTRCVLLARDATMLVITVCIKFTRL